LKLRIIFLAGLLFITQVALAEETLATDASIRELMEITQSHQLMDSAMAQMDSIVQASMQQAMAGYTPTAEQQAVIDDMGQKMAALIKQEMRWEVIEPKMVDLYRQSFTEEEVAGMLAFYKTPAGQAVIKKMPLVMQRSIAMMQEIMSPMMPKMQAIVRDAMRTLKKN
jgi:hypothetical protein